MKRLPAGARYGAAALFERVQEAVIEERIVGRRAARVCARIPDAARESRRSNARFWPNDGRADAVTSRRYQGWSRLVRIPDLPDQRNFDVRGSEDLTTGSVGRHLIRLTVPMFFGISSMMLTSMVDTIYIGWIGTRELAAVSFSFPVVMGAVVGVDGARRRRDVDHVAHARPRRSHARVCTRHAHAAAGADSGRVAGGVSVGCSGRICSG